MPAHKYTEPYKYCDDCKQWKLTRTDFYKWRKQCIDCYSQIRKRKYAKKKQSEKTVVVDAIPLDLGTARSIAGGI